MKENSPTNISITTETVLRTVVLLIFLVLIYILRDLALVILTSVVIASAIEPINNWLMGKGFPRVLSVITIYIGLFATIFLLVSIFIPPIFDDLFKLSNTIPAYIRSFDIFNYISDAPAKILNTLRDNVADIFSIDKILPSLSSLVGASGNFIDTAKSIFTNIVNFILIIVLSFYLAVQEKGIENFLRLVTPLHYEKYVIDLWLRSQKKIGLWMQGQILLGVLIGVFVFLGLSILGIRNALVLAIFAAIFELIPVFGPILAAAPAVLLSVIQGPPSLGLLVLGLFIVLQQFENHLIYPLVVRKMVGVPPLLVILFLIIGAKLFGIMGIILAVPTAVVVMELAVDIDKQKRLISKEVEKALSQ